MALQVRNRTYYHPKGLRPVKGKRINVPKLLVLEGYATDLDEAKALIAAQRIIFDGHHFSGTYLIMEILDD